MAVERSFIAIKPDGVQRGLVGEILGRFERKGFKLVGLKQLTPSRALAESHYGVHKERPFFAGLVDFITSGPVVAMVWEGEGVIASARKLIGATKPLEAEPGTIRGDLAVNIGRNRQRDSGLLEPGPMELVQQTSLSLVWSGFVRPIRQDLLAEQLGCDRGQENTVAVVARCQPKPRNGAGSQQRAPIGGAGPEAPPAFHRWPLIGGR